MKTLGVAQPHPLFPKSGAKTQNPAQNARGFARYEGNFLQRSKRHSKAQAFFQRLAGGWGQRSQGLNKQRPHVFMRALACQKSPKGTFLNCQRSKEIFYHFSLREKRLRRRSVLKLPLFLKRAKPRPVKNFPFGETAFGRRIFLCGSLLTNSLRERLRRRSILFRFALFCGFHSGCYAPKPQLFIG